MQDNEIREENTALPKEGISTEEHEKNQATSLMMKGVTILAVAGIVSKIFGAIFRIPLTNLIGAEGQSYYGLAYPIYQFFFTIASAGFPIAVSRMVSERIAKGDYINAQKSFRTALKATMLICAVSFCICFFGADFIAAFQKNPGAAASIRAVSVAILFTSVVASLRGYFQGHQNMLPTAVTEVIEQITRVAVGLGLAVAFYKTNLERAAAGATFGASAGMIAAMIALIIIYKKDTENRKRRFKASVLIRESNKERFREMLGIVIPITIGSSIMPLVMIIDGAIIMRRLLATGWSFVESKTLYGLISGFCDPLVNMPIIFIEAVCISLMPAVTRAFTLDDKSSVDKNISTGLKTMMIISYPCAVGLFVLAKPILHLLYPMKIQEADLAVHTLQILAISVITLSIMRILSTSLQGVGQMVLPVINLTAGALCKIFLTFSLTGIRALNINGAAIGTVTTFLVAGLLNYRALRKHADVRLDLTDIFIKPLISAVVMGAATWIVYTLLFMAVQSNALATLISIIIAVLIYFFMVFKTGVLSKDEIELIPKGETLYKIAEKLKITE